MFPFEFSDCVKRLGWVDLGCPFLGAGCDLRGRGQYGRTCGCLFLVWFISRTDLQFDFLAELILLLSICFGFGINLRPFDNKT